MKFDDGSEKRKEKKFGVGILLPLVIFSQLNLPCVYLEKYSLIDSGDDGANAFIAIKEFCEKR